MIIVGRVKFEFGMEDENFAFDLYSKWDDFCRSGFIDVADRLLTTQDKADSVLQIDCLELDLGTLAENDFYRIFPVRLEECLQETLRSLLHGAENPRVKRYTVSSERCRQLMHYLLHGYTGWEHGNGTFDLKQTMLQVIQEEAGKLRQFLLAEGYQETLRKRLVFRLEDGMLGSLVTLTVSGEAVFINRYTDFLIRNYSRLHRYQVSRKEYRETLWMLVLTYIWSVNRGYIARKELVGYTLRGLAAHLGIGIFVLIGYLTQGIEELLAGDVIRHELLEILEEIRYEERLNRLVKMAGNISGQTLGDISRRLLEKIGMSPEKTGLWENKPDDGIKDLCRRLADTVKRREILNGLTESDIELLVKIVAPADSEFIVTYARTLEKGKQKGMFEGKAGEEFRYVKWDFIFAVLLEKSFANLDRRQFVGEVLHRLSAHYGLDYGDLIEYFKKMPEELPGWLIGVLGELGEGLQSETFEVLKKPEGRMTEAEEKQVLEMLKRPLSCRQLLSRLNEPETIGLVKRFLPQEQGFILNYAERLTLAKEQGMFEGRAGGEFSHLKWEFIFQLALTDVFNRKYFALGVLRELAAHYALEVRDLLGYFYHYLMDEKEEGIASLWQTIRELWEEMEGGQVAPDTELKTENEQEEQLAALERFLLTGEIRGENRDMSALFMELKARIPERLRKRISCIPAGMLTGWMEQNRENLSFYAALLLWWLEDQSFSQEDQVTLNGMLQAALAGSGKVGVRELRLLLACCLEGRTDAVQRIWTGTEKIEFRLTEKDLPILWVLLNGFRRKEVADFIRSRKKEWSLLIFSASPESRKFLGKLGERAKYDPTFAAFLQEIFEMELPRDEERAPGVERVDQAVLWACLSGRKGTPEQQKQIGKWKTDRRACLQVLGILENNLVYQRIWIERVGNVGLRRLAGELLALEKKINFSWDRDQAWELLASCTLPEYTNLAVEELYLVFLRKLSGKLTQRQKEQLAGLISEEKNGFTLWKNSIRRLQYVLEQKVPGLEGKVIGTPDKIVSLAEEPVLIEVRNAGLVLFSPWFVQLFKRLALLEEEGKAFAGVEAQIRGIFILQALVDGIGEKEYEEQELFLNRLLVGLPVEEALPSRIEWREEEKQLVESLSENLRASWPKMKNTSPGGLRQSFLLREGVLEEQEKEWKLTVQQQSIDVLLDSLPWGYSMIRQPWMDKMLTVVWR